MTVTNLDGLTITAVEDKGIFVVKFTDEDLASQERVGEVGKGLYRYVLADNARVVLDLSGVKRIASSFIGLIISLGKQQQACNGRMVLCQAHGRLLEVLQVTNLNKIFVICDNLPASVHALV
jgi:anti-anti-sigma factor